MPSSSMSLTPLGDSALPQVLSRGKRSLSTRTTSLMPRCASRTAAAAPPGPAPMMTTFLLVMLLAIRANYHQAAPRVKRRRSPQRRQPDVPVVEDVLDVDPFAVGGDAEVAVDAAA